MGKRIAVTFMLFIALFQWNMGQIQKDIVKTSAGDLEIWFIGHASLMFNYNGNIIHVDPYSKQADYTLLPKANLILITHEHRDHLDTVAINAVREKNTQIISNTSAGRILNEGSIMGNNETMVLKNSTIESVPAYNIVHKRDDGNAYHPKGVGNGYVLTFGDVRVYVAGDTEDIPEMANLKNIDVAFLPMNVPFTMTPEMAANAARMVKPRILYPYHYGQTNTNLLVDLLKNEKQIEVRIRKM